MIVRLGQSGSGKFRIAILENHPATAEGYRAQLLQSPRLEVVGTARYGCDLAPLVERVQANIVILDIHVPASPDNPDDYPILHVVASLLRQHPALCIFVISMAVERAMIRSLVEAGICAYILKDDGEAYTHLGKLVLAAMSEDSYQPYLSPQIEPLVRPTRPSKEILTRRQVEALMLAAAHPEWNRSQLADQLGISYPAVRNLLWYAFQRLEVNTLPAAVAQAQARGIIPSSQTDRR